jgi:hypothetical protein
VRSRGNDFAPAQHTGKSKDYSVTPSAFVACFCSLTNRCASDATSAFASCGQAVAYALAGFLPTADSCTAVLWGRRLRFEVSDFRHCDLAQVLVVFPELNFDPHRPTPDLILCGGGNSSLSLAVLLQRGRSRRHTVAFIDHWRAGESCHFFRAASNGDL